MGHCFLAATLYVSIALALALANSVFPFIFVPILAHSGNSGFSREWIAFALTPHFEAHFSVAEWNRYEAYGGRVSANRRSARTGRLHDGPAPGPPVWAFGPSRDHIWTHLRVTILIVTPHHANDSMLSRRASVPVSLPSAPDRR